MSLLLVVRDIVHFVDYPERIIANFGEGPISMCVFADRGRLSAFGCIGIYVGAVSDRFGMSIGVRAMYRRLAPCVCVRIRRVVS